MRIKGKIKAAYIFSIMPGGIRSSLLTRFNVSESARLDSGLKNLAGLATGEKKHILSQFIKSMLALHERRKEILETSVLCGFVILGTLVLVSFLYSLFAYRILDDRIRCIESFLAGGGVHCALFPLLYGYTAAELRRSSKSILFSSKNHIFDLLLSIPAALCIAGLVIAASGPIASTSRDILLNSFTFIVATTIGPAVEEIFFRYMLFLVAGKKLGYPAAGAISTIIFTAIHIPYSLPLAAAYMGSGILLCILSYMRRGIFPSLAAHSLSNCIILLT